VDRQPCDWWVSEIEYILARFEKVKAGENSRL